MKWILPSHITDAGAQVFELAVEFACSGLIHVSDDVDLRHQDRLLEQPLYRRVQAFHSDRLEPSGDLPDSLERLVVSLQGSLVTSGIRLSGSSSDVLHGKLQLGERIKISTVFFTDPCWAVGWHHRLHRLEDLLDGSGRANWLRG